MWIDVRRAMENQQLIRWLQGEMRRLSGRDYRIKFDALDVQDLRELQRFVRDIAHEHQMAVNKARREPWRRA